MSDIKIPLDVDPEHRSIYEKNYRKATHDTGKLMLFAGDQKIEHLNDDFFGEGISPEDNDPEHMFRIASKAKIGVFASQLGLIAHYGMDYKDVPYIIKLNSKTHLVKTTQKDPESHAISNIHGVTEFKRTSGLHILGVGYTIYFGSEFETQMIAEAARLTHEAHLNGLFMVVWAYPRGKAVTDEKEPHLIAGAAGATACLGADFVKVNYPRPLTPEQSDGEQAKKEGISSAEALQEAVKAAGRTKLICAGGSSSDAEKFLKTLHEQIHIGGAAGNATGRNIHQRPLDEAIRFSNAISAITLDNASVEDAIKIYKGN